VCGGDGLRSVGARRNRL